MTTNLRFRRAGAIPAMALAAALLPNPAGALEIYTWVDDEGVVHYSESRPEELAATQVETFHIASTNSLAYDPDDYYWSILNQAERIGEQWSTIQEQKAEEQALARTAAAEARIDELERRLTARETADYVTAPPYYAPFAFFPGRHQRSINRGFHSRTTHEPFPPPHTDRDLTIPTRDPRPGWTPPRAPTTPPTPGFAR